MISSKGTGFNNSVIATAIKKIQWIQVHEEGNYDRRTVL
jgi:hypothetical protein